MLDYYTRIYKMFISNVSSSLNSPPGFDLADPEIEAKIIYGLVAFNLLTSLVGILANSLVFVAVFKTQGVASNFQYLVSILAAVDFTIALVVQPLLVLLILGRRSSNDLPWIFFVWRMVGAFAITMSSTTPSLIALDRFLKIASPKFNCENTMTAAKNAWVFACVIYCIRVTLCQSITSYFTVTFHGLCFVIMIVCYTVISYQVLPFLSHSRAAKARAGREGEIKAQTGNKPSPRLFACTVVMVLLAVLIGKVIPLCQLLTEPQMDHGLVFFTAVTVILSSSVVNPALYCFANKHYRGTLKKVLPFFTLGKTERTDSEENPSYHQN